MPKRIFIEVWSLRKLTAEQVASYFKVSPETIRKWSKGNDGFPKPVDGPRGSKVWIARDIAEYVQLCAARTAMEQEGYRRKENGRLVHALRSAARDFEMELKIEEPDELRRLRLLSAYRSESIHELLHIVERKVARNERLERLVAAQRRELRAWRRGAKSGCNAVPAVLAPFAGKLCEFQIAASQVPCVYFLIYRDQVAYVGQTVALGSRLASHANDGKLFDRVFYVPLPADAIVGVEAALIRKLKPFLNSLAVPRIEGPAADELLRQHGLDGGMIN